MSALVRPIAIIAAAALAVTAFNRPAQRAASRPADRTTLDSVYTADQAQRGDSIFRATCDKCHGAAAEGKDNDGGRLYGQKFVSNWDGVTLDQLHTTISTTMPSDNPKSLAAKDVSALIAYVLKQNQLPAGAVPLSESPDSLRAIKFTLSR